MKETPIQVYCVPRLQSHLGEILSCDLETRALWRVQPHSNFGWVTLPLWSPKIHPWPVLQGCFENKSMCLNTLCAAFRETWRLIWVAGFLKKGRKKNEWGKQKINAYFYSKLKNKETEPLLVSCDTESKIQNCMCPPSSVQFSRSVMSDSLRPHEPQHARPSCPSPTPRIHPNPCLSSQ